MHFSHDHRKWPHQPVFFILCDGRVDGRLWCIQKQGRAARVAITPGSSRKQLAELYRELPRMYDYRAAGAKFRFGDNRGRTDENMATQAAGTCIITNYGVHIMIV